MTPRRFAALFLAVMALGLITFGAIRGISSTGPAHGVRLVVAIEPPVDDTQRELARRVVEDRIGETGPEQRVVPAGDQLVVELGDLDLESARAVAALLERTGKFELHAVDVSGEWLPVLVAAAVLDPEAAAVGVRGEANGLVADDRWSELAIAEADAIGCTGRVTEGKRRCMRRGDAVLAAYVATLASRDPRLAAPADRMLAYGRIGETPTWRAYSLRREVKLDGRQIRHAETALDSVEIDVEDPTRITSLTGMPIAVLFDGVVKLVSTPDRITGVRLHVPTPGPSEKAAFINAVELVAMAEAGALHPLKIQRQEPFTRATGFIPRAWPFLAVALVLLIVAALLWRRRVTP